VQALGYIVGTPRGYVTDGQVRRPSVATENSRSKHNNVKLLALAVAPAYLEVSVSHWGESRKPKRVVMK